MGLRLLDLLLPLRCAACGSGERLLCDGCRAGLTLLRGPVCARCGAPTAWPVERCRECAGRALPFTSARAAVAYDGPARLLVAAWKEQGLRSFAATAADLVAAVLPPPPAACLAFVPGDAARTGWRGHNAAEGLARALAGRWGLPVREVLARSAGVRRQRGLSRGERRANVRHAFVAARESPAAVALVDDVYTTGATVAAAAMALRQAGARTVYVVAFARASRP